MTASAQKITQSARYQVGEVQSQTYGVGVSSGYGFVLSNSRSAPIASLTYATKEEAEEAKNAIESAVKNAVNIMGYSV